jgi:5-formyltetrahydrofolate cyclo-ligase
VIPPDDVILRKVKAELRKRLRGLRQTAPAEACLARSRAIATNLAELPELQTARHVALFWPIEARHEVDLRGFDAQLRTRGASVYYPSIDPDTREMTFRLVDDLATLEERGLGFAEPPADAAEAGALDAIVVPCLAAGPSGHRLGYGAGFYDRTLPRFASAFTVAVLYDYQLLAELPHDDHDVPVRALVTDRRTLRP